MKNRIIWEENKLIETLFNNGVPKSALPNRLKSNLIMQKLLQNIIRPKIIINNNEINNEYKNLLANNGKMEYQFSEISFNFSRLSKKEDTILIAKQIRKKF